MNLLFKGKSFFASFFLTSPMAMASMDNTTFFPVYLAELLVIGLVALALIFVFILILNDRKRQNLKIEQFNEEMEQKKSIAQMLINSIREKEQSVSKISQAQMVSNGLVNSSAGVDSATLSVDKLSLDHDKEKPSIDPRKLAVDGSVKQAYLGKNSYVENMRSACEKGVSISHDTVDSLLEVLSSAKNTIDDNLKSLNDSYQSLSQTIESLELDDKPEIEKGSQSEQNTLKSLHEIRDHFDELIEQKQLYKELYDDFYLELKTVQNETQILAVDSVKPAQAEAVH